MDEQCDFIGCPMRYSKALADEPPAADGSRNTGWYLPDGETEPDDLEAHDHRLYRNSYSD